MSHIDELLHIGTSTWLDDLSRERLDSGNVEELIRTKSIQGVTTNPAIFAAAMTKGNAYDEAIATLKNAGADFDSAVYSMAIEDVQRACDAFLPVYEASGGKDGRVSLEVDPRISEDRDATLAQAKELWERVDRPNAMIKIPAVGNSLPAIADALAAGISVNVTLIFSVERYAQVIEAFKDGITRAENPGDVHSVASFFVSRVDSEIDKRLNAIGTGAALSLKGKAGIANARLAYELFQKTEFPAGSNPQRPLWASTSVKNPEYPATMYVTELAGPNTVNTMPEATIDATLAEGGLHGDTLSGTGDAARQVFADLEAVGVDTADVFAVLEKEGVDKFVAAWGDLLSSVESRLA
ncbi:transaldolase [Corynebacterium incognita]|uniref:Transaldolase n=1 Tax=Corynebacterium incognita TaxID=2754725 RepID=A0A7G7CPT5_9CORY|nr:transaldolase [Corynebacterium incognita]QNE89601.1 transaldolase [Corynebacterium incognita]